MEEDINTEELLEAAEDTCRQLEREQEELNYRAEQLKTRLQVAEATKSMLNRMKQLEDENRLLRETNEEQERQLQEKERQLQEKDILLKEKDIQLQEKDTQLKELNKLSAGVAKKSSQDDVSKALRIYLNTSKRKTLAKREAAKTVLLELITAAKLEMSEDIMELLSHFDDEELTDQPLAAGTVNENVAELLTAEAQLLWQQLRDAGFIVADGYNLAEGVSANQAAYIADRMAEKLRIKKKWKLFQLLWGIPNLGQLAGTWQQTGKLPPKSSEIDKLTK